MHSSFIHMHPEPTQACFLDAKLRGPGPVLASLVSVLGRSARGEAAALRAPSANTGPSVLWARGAGGPRSSEGGREFCQLS